MLYIGICALNTYVWKPEVRGPLTINYRSDVIQIGEVSIF
jgi:hypothetical protein